MKRTRSLGLGIQKRIKQKFAQEGACSAMRRENHRRGLYAQTCEGLMSVKDTEEPSPGLGQGVGKCICSASPYKLGTHVGRGGNGANLNQHERCR